MFGDDSDLEYKRHRKVDLWARIQELDGKADRAEYRARKAKSDGAHAHRSASMLLQTYGRHLEGCVWAKTDGPEEPCACGLHIAIAELGSDTWARTRFDCCDHPALFHICARSGAVWCIGKKDGAPCPCTQDPRIPPVTRSNEPPPSGEKENA